MRELKDIVKLELDADVYIAILGGKPVSIAP